jgi:hypothetical protein
MSNTVQLPAAALTLSPLAPTINVSNDNRVTLPVGALTLIGLAPTITAGQQKLRYSGVGMGIKTTLGNSVE